MKYKYTIEMAKTELKELQLFFNKNRETETMSGKKWINETPLKIENIEIIINKLKELSSIYLNLSQNHEYELTLSTLGKYKELYYLAKQNNWTEIKSLDFNKLDFNKNAEYLYNLYCPNINQ